MSANDRKNLKPAIEDVEPLVSKSEKPKGSVDFYAEKVWNFLSHVTRGKFIVIAIVAIATWSGLTYAVRDIPLPLIVMAVLGSLCFFYLGVAVIANLTHQRQRPTKTLIVGTILILAVLIGMALVPKNELEQPHSLADGSKTEIQNATHAAAGTVSETPRTPPLDQTPSSEKASVITQSSTGPNSPNIVGDNNRVEINPKMPDRRLEGEARQKFIDAIWSYPEISDTIWGLFCSLNRVSSVRGAL